MRHPRIISILVALGSLLFLHAISHADTVHLKNGKVINDASVTLSRGRYTISSKGISILVPAAAVDRIEKDAPAAAQPASAAVPASPTPDLLKSSPYFLWELDAIPDRPRGLKVVHFPRDFPTSPPKLISMIDTPEQVTARVSIPDKEHRRLLIVACKSPSSALRIVDLSQPTSPSVHLVCQDISSPLSIAIEFNSPTSATVSYLGCQGNTGPSFYVLDMTDPFNPVMKGSIKGLGRVVDVCGDGGVAYLACMEGGVKIVDAKDPSQPRVIASLDAPNARGVSVAGNLLTVADDKGTQIVDVVDRSKPVVKGTFPNHPNSVHTGMKMNIDGREHTAMLAIDRDAGAQFIDITDPAAPKEYAHFAYGGLHAASCYATELRLSGNTAIGTFGVYWDLFDGVGANLQMIQAADHPESPNVVATLDIVGKVPLSDALVQRSPSNVYLPPAPSAALPAEFRMVAKPKAP